MVCHSSRVAVASWGNPRSDCSHDTRSNRAQKCSLSMVGVIIIVWTYHYFRAGFLRIRHVGADASDNHRLRSCAAAMKSLTDTGVVKTRRITTDWPLVLVASAFSGCCLIDGVEDVTTRKTFSIRASQGLSVWFRSNGGGKNGSENLSRWNLKPGCMIG